MYSVYVITNKLNGKQYVGFTSQSVQQRFSDHLCHAHKGSESWIHQAIRKHGGEAFDVETIYMSEDERHTRGEMEPYFINEYGTYLNGYNMTPGGDGSPMTPEKREKLSISMRGNQNSAGSRNGMKHPDNAMKIMGSRNGMNKPGSGAKMSAIILSKPLVSCPHCGKSGRGCVMSRWHFDNCKVRANV